MRSINDLKIAPLLRVFRQELVYVVERSRLILFQSEGGNLPLVPNGGKVVFSWPDDIICPV